MDVPLISRTKVPESWVNNSVDWTSLLAKRFRFPLDICEGEMRAANQWIDVLAARPEVRNTEVVHLGDDFAGVSMFTRGRSYRDQNNRQPGVELLSMQPRNSQSETSGSARAINLQTRAPGQ